MKKILSIVTAAVLLVSLSGCGKSNSNTDNSKKPEEKKEIIVGATPVPHEEILEKVKPILEKEGYTLKIKEFNDYVTPNTALNEGELDANFFQHVPYLEQSITEKKLNITYTVKVHIEPMGLYSNKIKSIAEIKTGAKIAVPNDATNEARALRLLEKNGLFKLKAGDLVTKLDITENPKNIQIQELDASMLPRTLADVDAAVINSNFAMAANLNLTKDAILLEAKDSPYANILAVKKGDERKPHIQALSKAITSPEIKKFIEDKYKGAIIPAF